MKTHRIALTAVSGLAMAVSLTFASTLRADGSNPTALLNSLATADENVGAVNAAANDQSLALSTGDVLLPTAGVAAASGSHAVDNAGFLADRGSTIDNDGFDLDLDVDALAVSFGMTTASLSGVTVQPVVTEIGFLTGQFFNVVVSNSNGINVVNANTGIASQANHIGLGAIVK